MGPLCKTAMAVATLEKTSNKVCRYEALQVSKGYSLLAPTQVCTHFLLGSSKAELLLSSLPD